MRKSFQITAIFTIIIFIINFILIFYIYSKITIPTHPLNIGISLLPFSVLRSAILIQIPKGVNERLKDLNQEYFSPLLNYLYKTHFDVYEEKMREIYINIIKYGKYGKLPLYPGGLMRELDTFLKM